ncbi:hypothetical protein BCR39DRAFT_562461 [Naematelia encephala]|uniref:CASTOR ACT domain-containing protein n=1 Tax=Naematelia encephala TaxID=71784 RepID=A0A1Y2AJB9_9TREE|nr:hypothetical protein BCR39DRAFT_562461 [Naematelia encephala]
MGIAMRGISIRALDDPVSIVHIPVELSDKYASNIYWSIIDAPALSDEFFNITSNRIEIAIFGSVALVAKQWEGAGAIDTEVLINAPWRVYEISSGEVGDVGNHDSPHLRYVSIPLARAGISILYQSSYFTDFLLVKESDFTRASEIFASEGWHIDTGLPSPRRQSQLFTLPTPPLTSSPPSPLRSLSPAIPIQPAAPAITVLPAPLACVALVAHSPHVVELLVWPERVAGGCCRPFLSFTRTEDGASLLTETRVLRALFSEREVQTGGEIWEEGTQGENYHEEEVREEGRGGTGTWTPPPEGKRLSLPAAHGGNDQEIPIKWEVGGGLEVDEMNGNDTGRKSCLQLDLRGIDDQVEVGQGAYHLDKSGLIVRFSSLLDGSDIKMLYSSTFHTANILVEAGDVRRAKRLLEHVHVDHVETAVEEKIGGETAVDEMVVEEIAVEKTLLEV